MASRSLSLRGFCAALAYFTRIPDPFDAGKPPVPGLSAHAPWVGWVVGVIAGSPLLAAPRWYPPLVAATLGLAFSVWITRALHEDGWADFCDGFGGATGHERTLAIMRDPHTGVFGTTGLIVVLLLRFSALAALAGSLASSPWTLLLVVVSSHASSRFAAVSFMYTDRYASPGTPTRAGAMTARFDRTEIVFAALGGALPPLVLTFVFSWAALVPLLAIGLARGMLGAMFRRRLGGYTGDCLGAVQQVSEVGFLLAAAIVFGTKS